MLGHVRFAFKKEHKMILTVYKIENKLLLYLDRENRTKFFFFNTTLSFQISDHYDNIEVTKENIIQPCRVFDFSALCMFMFF